MIKRDSLPLALQRFYEVPNFDKIKAARRNAYCRHMPSMVLLGTKELAPPGAAYWSAKKGQKLPFYGKPAKKNELPFTLRPNQVPVFEKIKDTRGALVNFKTGQGKTVVAAALTHYLGLKTLVLAHSLDNVEYFQKTFEKFLGADVGAYYSAKKDIKPITVTTHRSAVSKQELFQDYGFDVLIVDEADIFMSEKQQAFVCSFGADRVFGFTGTIKTNYDLGLRAGATPSLERFYGLMVKGIANEEKNPLKDIFYTVYQKEYLDEYGFKIEPKDWLEFKPALDSDTDRKQAQMDFLLDNHNEGDHTLVLFDRISDSELFFNSYSQISEKSYMLNGQMTKKKRKESIDGFKETGGIMFGQYKAAGRGLDLPKCQKLFIFCPIKGENSLRQMVGRVVREYEGKTSYVYDWVDTSLLSQFKERKKCYKKYFKISPKIK